MRNPISIFFWPMLILVLPILGCETPQTLPKPAKLHQAKAPQIVAEPEEAEPYHYSVVAKRNPFRSYFAANTPRKKSNSELEQYELDQLKLVAVVNSPPRLAMVEDPTGKGHVIKLGTVIGRDGGQVRRIRKREVVVLVERPHFPTPLRQLVPLRLRESPGLAIQ